MVFKKLLFCGVFLSYFPIFAVVPTAKMVRRSRVRAHAVRPVRTMPIQDPLSSSWGGTTTRTFFQYPEGTLEVVATSNRGFVLRIEADLTSANGRYKMHMVRTTLENLSSSFATEAEAQKELLLATKKELKMYCGLTALALGGLVCCVGRGSTSVIPVALLGGATVFCTIQGMRYYYKIDEGRLRDQLFTKAAQSLPPSVNEG